MTTLCKTLLPGVLAAGTLALLPSTLQTTAGTDWRVGDVFVGIGQPKIYAGQYQVYSEQLSPKETLTDPARGYTTGCAVDPVTGYLWTTSFDANQVTVFSDLHPHPVTETITVSAQNGGGAVESIVLGPLTASPRYVLFGNVDGNNRILRYTLGGTFQSFVNPPSWTRGTDWLDLIADGTEIYYTSEDAIVRVVDAQTGALKRTYDLSARSAQNFAIRLLPPGDGVTGGFVAANPNGVDRYDGAGRFLQRYMLPDRLFYFAINLSPDGQYLWTATNRFSTPAAGSDVVYPAMIGKIHLPSGAVVAGPVQSRSGEALGLCVKLEYVAATSQNTCYKADTAGNILFDANGAPIAETCRAVESCNGLGDQDGDGLDDARDPDCISPVNPELCDGFDNNNNGIIDDVCTRATTEGVPFSIRVGGPVLPNVRVSYAASGLPSWLLFDQATGTFAGTPPFTAQGQFPVTVQVKDTGLNLVIASSTFSWVVQDVNLPPAFTSVPGPAPVPAAEGQFLSIALAASDPDNDTLTFAASGLPAGVTANSASGVISGRPAPGTAGLATIAVTVSDGRGGSAVASFILNIAHTDNQPPICTGVMPVQPLWPPNHKLVAIPIIGVTDPDGDSISIAIDRIDQDEPTQTVGDGNTVIDAAIRTGVAAVRAERSGAPKVPGNGRVYYIDFTATDARGASCTGTLQVGVPHDLGKGPIVADGRKYNSLTGLPLP